MAAYATSQSELLARASSRRSRSLRLAEAGGEAPEVSRNPCPEGATLATAFVAQLVEQLADHVAAAVTDRLIHCGSPAEEWYDSRHAAEYLGVHRDTLRKLAAERSIPAEQDGPGCKLYFKRSDLDTWRRSGGRTRHLAHVA
jgi:excisionase family DNA binding protein